MRTVQSKHIQQMGLYSVEPVLQQLPWSATFSPLTPHLRGVKVLASLGLLPPSVPVSLWPSPVHLQSKAAAPRSGGGQERLGLSKHHSFEVIVPLLHQGEGWGHSERIKVLPQREKDISDISGPGRYAVAPTHAKTQRNPLAYIGL